MPNPLLLYGAEKALSKFGNYLGQRSATKKRQSLIDEEIARQQGLKSNPYFDVNGAMSAYDRKAIIDSSRSGRRIDKSLGLDTGQAQGGALENLQSNRLGMLGDLRLKNEIGTAQRNDRIDANISNLKLGKPTQPSTAGLLTDLAGIGIDTYAGMESGKQTQQANNRIMGQSVPSQQVQSEPGLGYGYIGDRTMPFERGGGNPSGYEQFNYNQPEQVQDPMDALKFQQQQLQNQILQQKLDKGNTSSEPTDWNSKLYPTLNSVMNKWNTGRDSWIKGNKNSIDTGGRTPIQGDYGGDIVYRDPTLADYEKRNPKPDIRNLINTVYGDKINRDLGGGQRTLDSLGNNFADMYGYPKVPLDGQPKQAGFNAPMTNTGMAANQFGQGFGQQSLSPELESVGMSEFSDWNELTSEEKIKVLQMIGEI